MRVGRPSGSQYGMSQASRRVSNDWISAGERVVWRGTARAETLAASESRS